MTGQSEACFCVLYSYHTQIDLWHSFEKFHTVYGLGLVATCLLEFKKSPHAWLGHMFQKMSGWVICYAWGGAGEGV